MARWLYGGTPADFVVMLGERTQVPDTDPPVNGRVALIPEDGITLLVYDAPGGQQVTDLLDASMLPISELVTSVDDGSLGTIPLFYGPDGWNVDLYVSADGSNFFRMPPSASEITERLTVVETSVAGLSLDDLVDVNTAGGGTGQVLTRQADGTYAPADAGTGTVSSVNGVAPVGGNVTLAPSNLNPPAAPASQVSAVAAIVGARLLQVGSGYPPRPAAANWVNYVGTVEPVTGVQDGDTWDQPVIS